MENDVSLNLRLVRLRKAGPIGTVLLIAIVLAPLAYGILAGDMSIFNIRFLLCLLSRQFYFDLFTPFPFGSVNQPATMWFLVCFTAASIVALPYTAIVRKISNRTTRLGHWAFAAPLVAICVLLLSLLVQPFFWLIRYLISMGYTPRRVEGLLYTIGSGVGVLAYLRWAIRWRREVQSIESSEEDANGQKAS